MNRFSKHFVVRPAAVWLALTASLLVFGWRLTVFATHYFGGQQRAETLSSIRQFKQDLTPNHANTRIVFCQDTEKGVGIYFCSTTGGNSRLLCENKEKNHSWKRFTMLGWSPDDSLFACAWPDNKQDKELILIFNGATGERLGSIVPDQNLYQLVWMSNDSFAYSTRNDIRIVSKQSETDWVHKRFFAGVATNLEDFTAISDHSVAWRDAGDVWLLDFSSPVPQRIWTSTTNTLVEFSYATASGCFLLNCSDENGQFLLRFRVPESPPLNAGRLGPYQDFIRNVSWTGKGSAFAYLTNDLEGSAFCIKSGGDPAPIMVPWHGGVRSFTLSGQHLYFSGNPDNKPPGLWDYDLQSKEYKCIFANLVAPFKNGLGSASLSQEMTNSLGEHRFYHLWTPTHITPGRKYPLLLAQEFNMWFPYFQIAANCGFYVAVVDRPFSHTWNGSHERTWTEDVTSLHKLMAQNPNIDTNKIYLYACSAETNYLSPLLSTGGELWKGAILFTPTLLPDPSKMQNKRILIVDGKADRDATERLPAFQDQAAQQGTEVTLFLQDGADHVAASGLTEQTRSRQFSKFLLQNH